MKKNFEKNFEKDFEKNVEFFLEKILKKKLEKKMKKTNFEETKILKKKLKKAQNLEIILLFPCAESRCELVISRTGHLPMIQLGS